MVYAQSNICLGEWHTQTSLGFWDTNRSLNLGQTTRLYKNQKKKKKKKEKKKRTCWIVEFSFLDNHRVKLKESEKKDKYLDLTRKLEKLRNMKVAIIPIVIGVLGTVTKGTGGLGNKRKSGDHPKYCISDIDQNTQKSPGDLKRLAVTYTPVKDYQR